MVLSDEGKFVNVGEMRQLHVVLEKQKEGGYIAYVPELPGCHTQGETRGETIRNIKEARDVYLQVLKDKHRHSVPRVKAKICGNCNKGKLYKFKDEVEPGILVEAFKCDKCGNVAYSQRVMEKVEALHASG